MTDRFVQSAVPSLDVRNCDIWAAWAEGHTIAIMTNGMVKANGCATMGQGTAFEAARRCPDLARKLGTKITDGGKTELGWEVFRQEIDVAPSPSSFQVQSVKGIAGSSWILDRDQARLGDLSEAGSGFLKSITSLNSVLRLRECVPRSFCELGVRPVLRLRSASGRTIVGTPDAEVLTVEGWKCLKDLKKGEAIACPRKLGSFGKRSMTGEKIDAVAFLIADGGISIDRGQISYTKSDAVLHRRFRTCVEWFGARISRVRQVRRTKTAFVFDRRINSNGKVVGVIHQFLRQLNLMGRKSREKVLPPEILELRKPLLSRFLGRLWSGDGFVLAAPNRDVQYSTSSDVFARQIQHLLHRFGIWSTLRYRPKARGWEVGIGDWENFHRFSVEIAPWLMGQTRRDFRALEARWPAPKQLGSTGDIIPNGSELLLAAQTQAGVSAKEMKADGIHAHYREGRPAMRATIAKAERFLWDLDLLVLGRSDVRWDVVKTIEDAGTAHVFGMSIDVVDAAANCFLASDIYCRTSPGRAGAGRTVPAAPLPVLRPVSGDADGEGDGGRESHLNNSLTEGERGGLRPPTATRLQARMGSERLAAVSKRGTGVQGEAGCQKSSSTSYIYDRAPGSQTGLPLLRFDDYYLDRTTVHMYPYLLRAYGSQKSKSSVQYVDFVTRRTKRRGALTRHSILSLGRWLPDHLMKAGLLQGSGTVSTPGRDGNCLPPGSISPGARSAALQIQRSFLDHAIGIEQKDYRQHLARVCPNLLNAVDIRMAFRELEICWDLDVPSANSFVAAAEQPVRSLLHRFKHGPTYGNSFQKIGGDYRRGVAVTIYGKPAPEGECVRIEVRVQSEAIRRLVGSYDLSTHVPSAIVESVAEGFFPLVRQLHEATMHRLSGPARSDEFLATDLLPRMLRAVGPGYAEELAYLVEALNQYGSVVSADFKRSIWDRFKDAGLLSDAAAHGAYKASPILEVVLPQLADMFVRECGSQLAGRSPLANDARSHRPRLRRKREPMA